MKKILALLIAIVCIFSCTLTANAASFITDSEGSMEIQYHSYSNYTITLPTMSDGLSGYVELRDGEIEEGYRVEIHATNLNEDGYLPITYTKNPEIVGYLSFIGQSYHGDTWTVTPDNTMLCYFSAGEYGDYVSQSFTINSVDDRLKPGDYTGLLTYRVTCRYVPSFEQ